MRQARLTASGRARTQLGRRFLAEQAPPLFRIVPREQVGERDLDEVRVAVPGLAVGERELRALGNGVHPLCARLAHGAEVESLEQPELLEEDRRLAPRARLEDLVVVVIDRERLLPGRRPVVQVLLREEARVALAAAVEPLALLEADDLLRNEAAVPAVVCRLELRIAICGGGLGLGEDAPVGLAEDA